MNCASIQPDAGHRFNFLHPDILINMMFLIQPF